MERDDQFSRRRMLQFTGAAAVTTLVAGCADEGPGDEEEDPVDDEDDPVEDDDDPAEDEEDPAEDEDDPDEDEENGNGEAIDPDEEIELDGEAGGWIGVAPDEIADEDNPTLVLQEGESYEITFENVDGTPHNIEIVDEDDEIVDDYESDEIEEEGETETLEVDEVTDEMYEYVCRPHETAMRGSIEVEGNGNGDDEEEENGDDENGDENGADDENGDDNDE